MEMDVGDFFYLKINLGILYTSVSDWKRVVVSSIDMSEGNIPATGTAFDAWETILKPIENDRDSLIKLLQFVTRPEEKAHTNQFLLNLLDKLLDAHQRQIDTLAQAIKRKQCVLFLGPSLLICRDDKSNLVPFNKAFSTTLANRLRQRAEPIYFEESKIDQLSYIAQRYNKISTFTPNDLGKMANDFYNQYHNTDYSIYDALSELYFPIIINTNPDKILHQWIERKKPNSCIYRYYSFENDPGVSDEARPIQNQNDSTSETSADSKTLFYNLLGSFDAPGSLILSESRLLKFMDKILREQPPIDKKIKAELDDQKYYFFLGFDLDQWYVKILFTTVLRLSQLEGRGFSVLPANIKIDSSNQEFFEEEFKFYFIPNDLGRFVEQLADRYRTL